MSEDFKDPLENYDPKQYSDPLEQALAEETVEVVETTPYASVSPDMPVHQAIEKLASLSVACLVVEEQGKLIGVFTDRDALDKVALEHDKISQGPVRKVMTANPVYVYDSDCLGALFTVMAVGGHRHVPVLGGDGKVLGIASPQRVVEYLRSYLAA